MSVKTIAIVHHVHTDFGYTDHQSICRINQKEYISKAIRYILDTENYPQGSRFCWTQEQLDSLKEWWESATKKAKDKTPCDIAGSFYYTRHAVSFSFTSSTVSYFFLFMEKTIPEMG